MIAPLRRAHRLTWALLALALLGLLALAESVRDAPATSAPPEVLTTPAEDGR